MLFKPKPSKEAEALFEVVTNFAVSLMNDSEVFISKPPAGVGGSVLGLCCFLVAGIFGNAKVAQEMIEVYKNSISEDKASRISKKELNQLLDHVNSVYGYIRDILIKTQDKYGNDTPHILKALADALIEIFGIENTPEVNQALQEYISTFLNKAQKII